MSIDWEAVKNGTRPLDGARYIGQMSSGRHVVEYWDRVYVCNRDGRCSVGDYDGNCDLIVTHSPEVSERVDFWNIYNADHSTDIWDTKDRADTQFNKFPEAFLCPPIPVTTRIEKRDGKIKVVIHGEYEG